MVSSPKHCNRTNSNIQHPCELLGRGRAIRRGLEEATAGAGCKKVGVLAPGEGVENSILIMPSYDWIIDRPI